ncbi:MAG: ribonuclease VapC [Candidatus Altiarchaeota archaeon]|nr:ribonuclease VapC [Candidatus Altiarchaeota archaeon]
MKKRLLDTCVINRSELNFSDGSYVITNNVLSEVRDETVKSILQSALRAGRIMVEEPGARYIKEVREKAGETGDLQRLSDTDIELIALALEKKYLLLSDDYSIQNMCKHLDIEYGGGVQDGISKKLKWFMVCEGCGRRIPYDAAMKECSVCGSEFRKKAVSS